MAGAPPKYKTPEELEEAIDSYFEKIEDEGDIPLIEELALELGYAGRQSLLDQKKRGSEFSDIIVKAKAKCGVILNKLALKGIVKERTACLNLSANHGLNEKKDIDITSAGKVIPTQIITQGSEIDTDSTNS